MWFIIFVTLVVAETLSHNVLWSHLPSEFLREWNEFKSQYNKTYLNEVDDINHYNTYMENKQRIREHNKLYELGRVTYKQKTNKFSDMKHDDFLTNMTRYFPSDIFSGSGHCSIPFDIFPGIRRRSIPFDIRHRLKKRETLHAPESVDWRNNGYVTHVKDQGYKCGFCTVFDVTGVLEGQYFKKTGKLVPLSEQNLLECMRIIDCIGGCEGKAFKYIMNNGINSEESYPYHKERGFCEHKPIKNILKVERFYKLPARDEMVLRDESFNFGPISVAIDASPESFMHYGEGIYSDSECNEFLLNHKVLLVGYGSERCQDYWIVKNSWGTSWGEDGYMKIARNKNNMCGIATDAWIATVTSSNASPSQFGCNSGLLFFCSTLCIIVQICLPYIINSNIIY